MVTSFASTCISFIFLVGCIQHGNTENTTLPSDREDVMGEYTVTNKEQCRRLCWYRRLCGSFSYNTNTGNASNCILHANISSNTQVNPQTPSYWAERPASGYDLVNGCAPRPCNDTEVCVPAISPSGETASHYKCLPLPAICQKPDIKNADVKVTVGEQDDTTNVECEQGHVAVPKGVSTEIRCQVTSRWTAFRGSCAQAEFFHPNGSDFLGIPWPMTDGWEMCVKGKFSTMGQLAIGFAARPDFTNLDLYISFRYLKQDRFTFWNTRMNGNWDKRTTLGEMPLTPGDDFNITLSITNEQFHIVLLSHNDTTFGIPLVPGGRPDVSNSKWILCCLLTSNFLIPPIALDREDVMGEYTVTNKEQCRRLCWYRRLRRSFSYNMDAGTSSNCILHADISSNTQLNPQTASDWVERSASGDDVENGCSSSPCSDTKVCVPAISPSGETASHHKCLPLPAICQPPHVVNADVFVVGDNQDDKAHVECQQGYVAVPKGVSTEIRCQVTYKWTAFNGSCEQAEFFYPAGWDILGIPWPVADGWEMCVKGMFLADGQMTTTSISTSYNSQRAENGTSWNTQVNGYWYQNSYLGEMLLTPGDHFRITLSIKNDQLNIVHHTHDNATYSITLAPGPNIQENLQTPSDWVERPASGDDVVNGCAPRPCSDTELCAPAISPSGETASHYKCLPLPARCQRPDIINADVTVAGGKQDETTNVECQQGYVAVPKGISTEIRCQVTSKWTAFNGSCEQAEFLYPAGSDYLGIPWPVRDGWEMCVKGKFLAAGQMDINFTPEPEYTNVDLHVAFRYNFHRTNKTIWNTRTNSRWDSQEFLDEVFLTPGDHFNITLSITNNQLNIVLHSRDDATFSLELVPGGRPDVSNSKWKAQKAWTSSFHCFRPEAARRAAFQELQPAPFLSTSTTLRHVVFGRPRFLLPSGVHPR
ncbi:hypothetical protein BaRGS_00040088, partial [Batillaria attramentaria]